MNRRLAARIPRIIEFEPQPTGGDYQVARRSLQPPAVLRVCSIARSEAQRVYEKHTVDLKHIQSDLREKYVYYNFENDILLFGESATLSGIAQVLADARKIEKVAWVIQDTYYNNSKPLEVLRTLHGDTGTPVGRPAPERSRGCKSLKEVFLVVKSKIWELGKGEIDWTVSWRKPTSEGRGAAEIAAKETLVHYIKNVKDGVPLWKHDPHYLRSNEWIGNKAPNFKFVSFTPLSTINGPILDGLTISQYSFERLGPFFTPARVETLNSNTGCRLIIPKYNERRADLRLSYAFDSRELVKHFELGFYGSPAAIEKAKVEVRKLMVILHISEYFRSLITIVESFERIRCFAIDWKH